MKEGTDGGAICPDRHNPKNSLLRTSNSSLGKNSNRSIETATPTFPDCSGFALLVFGLVQIQLPFKLCGSRTGRANCDEHKKKNVFRIHDSRNQTPKNYEIELRPMWLLQGRSRDPDALDARQVARVNPAFLIRIPINDVVFEYSRTPGTTNQSRGRPIVPVQRQHPIKRWHGGMRKG